MEGGGATEAAGSQSADPALQHQHPRGALGEGSGASEYKERPGEGNQCLLKMGTFWLFVAVVLQLL